MTQIIFGTDGWRGRIAEDYTFDNVRRCAQGFAAFLQTTGAAEKGVVIGYDQRFAAEHFAAAAAEVLAANGVPVWLTQSNTPTPAISYSVQARRAAGAINITASHNPPGDCGFKVRDGVGGAIPPDDLKRIEAAIPDISGVKRMKLDDARSDGIVRVFDPAPDYIALLNRLVDVGPIIAAGYNVVVDCMWGNGAGWFPRLLAGGATRVHEVHNERNPIFPKMLRPEPIPPNVDDGLSYVGRLGADVALITDGDADRVGLGDENGRFIDQLRVYGRRRRLGRVAAPAAAGRRTYALRMAQGFSSGYGESAGLRREDAGRLPTGHEGQRLHSRRAHRGRSRRLRGQPGARPHGRVPARRRAPFAAAGVWQGWALPLCLPAGDGLRTEGIVVAGPCSGENRFACCRQPTPRQCCPSEAATPCV